MSTKTKYVIAGIAIAAAIIAAVVIISILKVQNAIPPQVAAIQAPSADVSQTPTASAPTPVKKQDTASGQDKQTQEKIVGALDGAQSTGGKVTTTLSDTPIAASSLPAELSGAPARIIEGVKALTSLPLTQEMTPEYEAALNKYWYGRGTQAQAIYALGAGGRLSLDAADIHFYQSADTTVSDHVFVVAFVLRDAADKQALLVQGWYDASVGMTKLTKAVPNPDL